MSESNEIKQINLDKICRTCLCEGETKPLYNDCTEEVCIVEMLMSCTLVQFVENDGLPRQICDNCIQEINRSYKFALKCEESDMTIRGYIKTLKKSLNGRKINSNNRIQIKNEVNLSQKDNTENCMKQLLDNELSFSVKSEDEIESANVLELEDAGNGNIVSDDEKHEDFEYETCIANEAELLTIENAVSDKKVKVKKSKEEIKESRRKSVPPYQCKKCNESFPLYYLLKEHFRKAQHSKKDYGKRPCSVCSKMISYSHLRHHMRIHTSEKPYCCEFCGKRFIISSNLIRHKRVHSGERPYKCEICNRGFTQSTRLKDHIRTHTGERPFVCNVCGKCFGQTANFKTHLKRHEKEDSDENGSEIKSANQDESHAEVNLKCEICSQTYKTKGALKTHQVTHAEKKYTCDVCGRGFVNINRLKKHSKSHAEVKPFSCVVCNKTFTMKTSLKNHMYIHTGEKRFPCQQCDKAFTQVGQLTYHMRTHSGVRPYSCHYCGKTFALNGNLTVHLRQHTGVTPYICPVCCKGFYDSSSMKKHLRAHNVPHKKN